MDIYKYINSVDIKNHLIKIEYKFSSIEAAWLVWQSKFTSLKEKHDAWNEIIRTMPDCELPKRAGTRSYPSLHDYLYRYMNMQKNQLEILQRKDNSAVYSYSVQVFDDDDWEYENCALYSNFPVCLEKGRAHHQYHPELPLEEFMLRSRILIKKIWIDGEKCSIQAEFNGYGEVISILQYGDLTDDEENLIRSGFKKMWFTFPTPFKKGDIVTVCGCNDDVFVLDQLDSESEARDSLWQIGDSSDMVARGYFIEPHLHNIYYECMHKYMNLEYYRGEITGIKRIFKALSSYLKEDIDITLYSNSYHAILVEEQAKIVFPREYTDAGLALAGLTEKSYRGNTDNE